MNNMKTNTFLFLLLCFLIGSAGFAQGVFITKTGKKYHQENCQYLRYSKIKITLAKANEAGYTACINYSSSKKSITKNASTSNLVSQTNSSNAKKAKASQCTGKTKAGARCKRKTKNANGRCYQHQ